MTENLLTITRMNGPGVLLRTEEEVIEEIVGSAIVKYHRNPSSLPVKTEIPDDILTVTMDATLIEQVLLNLFENVSLHGQNATQIWVYLTRETDCAVISVEDDGCGFSEKQLHQIRKEILPPSGDTSPDGRRNMGIGLSVCRSIICAHGGELLIDKSRHGGAAVSFSLPSGRETEKTI